MTTKPYPFQLKDIERINSKFSGRRILASFAEVRAALTE